MAKKATSILKGMSKRFLRVFNPGDRWASSLLTRFNVTRVRGGGTLLVTANPDVVAVLHVGADSNYCISVLCVIQGLCALSQIHFICLFTLACFCLGVGPLPLPS